MPKFIVQIPEVHKLTITVEAPNPHMAKLKANEILEGTVDIDQIEVANPIYSHTLEMEEWTVSPDQS